MRFYLWLDKAAEKFKLNVRKLAQSLCAESISSSTETPQHQLYQHHINYHKKRFSVCTHEARIEINKNNWKRHNSQSLKHFKVCLLCKRTATEGCSYTTIEYVLSSARLDSRHKAHKFARMNQQQTGKKQHWKLLSHKISFHVASCGICENRVLKPRQAERLASWVERRAADELVNIVSWMLSAAIVLPELNVNGSSF